MEMEYSLIQIKVFTDELWVQFKKKIECRLVLIVNSMYIYLFILFIYLFIYLFIVEDMFYSHENILRV